MTLYIPGQIRSKKNSKRLVRVHGRTIPISSRAYMEWETGVRTFCAGLVPTSAPVSVQAVVHYKGQRPDLSGAMESIGDALEGVLWENDKQIESWDGSRLVYNKTWQGIIITIREYDQV